MAGAPPTAGPGRRRPGHPTAGGVSHEGRRDEGWRLRPRPCERGCPAAVRRTAGGGLGRGRGAPGGGVGRAEGGPMPPLALPGRGLYSAERGSRSEAAGSASTCERRFAAEPGARVTAAGSAGPGDTRLRERLRAAGQPSPAPSESPLPGAPAAPHPTLPPSRNLGQVDNSRGGQPARAVCAARPSPGLRGSRGAGGLAMRAARAA